MKREFDIYLVDDDEDFLFLYYTIVTKAGYKAKKFNNPKDVIEAISESPPKILILDLLMPDFNGDELMIKVSELKLINSFIPIMLSSADFNDKKRFELGSLGLDIILSKTASTEEFLRVVEENMNEWKVEYS
jgi:DNA-binding response OmpR family regulator